ncbi:hypothetical protein Hanom_Chr11g01059601 [Helianthus anomalus]
METPINSQSLENLHQNHEYVSIIITYKLLCLMGEFTRQFASPISFSLYQSSNLNHQLVVSCNCFLYYVLY